MNFQYVLNNEMKMKETLRIHTYENRNSNVKE